MLNKNYTKKTIASAILIGSFLSSTLTGCYASVLDDTMLDSSVVVTFEDGTKDIARVYCTTEDNYVIYRSVINETYYADDDFGKYRYRLKNIQNFPIVNVEQVSAYLTEEDITNLRSSNSHDTVTSIMARIISSNETIRVRE